MVSSNKKIYYGQCMKVNDRQDLCFEKIDYFKPFVLNPNVTKQSGSKFPFLPLFIVLRNVQVSLRPLEQACTFLKSMFGAGMYFLKVNNGNTRTMGEICSNFTIKNDVF